MRHVFVCLTLLCAPACTHFAGNDHVVVSSEPPGAAVLIDGADSGYTTPCRIELDDFGSHDHRITVQKQGFGSEERQVFYRNNYHLVRWKDGAADWIYSLPLFWTLGDWFLPFDYRWSFVPQEVHVQLLPAGEAPVVSTKIGPAKTSQR